MNKTVCVIAAFAAIWVAVPNAIAENACSSSRADNAEFDCAVKDLKIAVGLLNDSFRALIQSAPGIQHAALQVDQMSWISDLKARCEVENRSEDFAILNPVIPENEGRVFCATREIRNRTVQIKASDSSAKSMKPGESRVVFDRPKITDFLKFTPVARKSGKWYFEIFLDRRGIADSQKHIGASWPTTFWIGCGTTDSSYDIGRLVHISNRNNRASETVGIAIDLDRGKVHIHQDGRWNDGTPNENNGKRIKKGLSYVCAVDSTIAMQPLLTNKLVRINFGDSPFKYPLAKNFKPFHRGFYWIQGGVTTDRRLYVDYRQLQDEQTGIAFLKEEFFAPRESGPGLAVHTSRIAQVNVDCNTEEVMQEAQLLIGIDGNPVATRHMTREVDHRPGVHTLGGRFVKSLCFMKKHQVSLPPPEFDEIWSEMPSPVPSIKISEAIERRSLQNGLLMVKQLNETASPTDIFGRSSRKLVGISALDCKDISTTQLVGVRYDDKGVAIGMDFFRERSPIKMEQNRLRFAKACATGQDERKDTSKIPSERKILAQAPTPVHAVSKPPKESSYVQQPNLPKKRTGHLEYDGRDLRHCLDATSNFAVIRCVSHGQ